MQKNQVSTRSSIYFRIVWDQCLWKETHRPNRYIFQVQLNTLAENILRIDVIPYYEDVSAIILTAYTIIVYTYLEITKTALINILLQLESQTLQNYYFHFMLSLHKTWGIYYKSTFSEQGSGNNKLWRNWHIIYKTMMKWNLNIPV